jgi:Probable zinc-ribbon domain
MSDRTLVCRDCGQSFVFTAGEQAFYSERGYNEPQRCPACRAARKADIVSGRLQLVRARDGSSVRANAGQAGLLPRVLPGPPRGVVQQLLGESREQLRACVDSRRGLSLF